MVVLSDNIKDLQEKGLLYLGENVEIQEQVILCLTEEGNSGTINPVYIGDNTIIRAGAIIYEGVHIGENCRIGHHVIVRSFSKIGNNVVLSHKVIIEHHSSVGNWVRISPHSHITSHVTIEDRVALGAGVITVNSKYLAWKRPDMEVKLVPPYFGYGCRVGSGTTVLSGVKIGEMSMVGAGSVVTKDIADHKVAFGNPATVQKDLYQEHQVPNGLDQIKD
ncbi:acyltransferase [Bacillus wiedmannii]|uniref:acyltransferase n=1 Tax=Bacillus wiedmannii TaxID=1890302 RepID=UPI000BFA844C|nr:acyltransferase [Bacillus wiedmannii]PFZ92291.1 hypothetical protein COL83_16995 [Bacillus wiedmannii]